MVDRTKKLKARFYQLPSGRKPVREWLLSLEVIDRKAVGRDLQLVEFGWPIGMPYCRSMGRGLWELRSDLSNETTARVLFCTWGSQMVLLHGFIKKSQTTPQRDLALALQRMKEVTENEGS